tara:strand:+ start:324 stop:743 length:420 start_codon:yes stop_codon:yes gene_type:complete
VKIIFKLERDSDGYPPEDWEGIWATPTSSGAFRLDNIPFYATGVSDGDLVSAEEHNGELVFKELVEASDNCTVRVIIYDLENAAEIRSKLGQLGCSIEGVGIPGLIACSFKNNRYSDISTYLEKAHAEGLLDYQESALR